MDMMYFEQLNMRKFLNHMENPREMTVIHDDFLQGMEKEEFISAYKSLYQFFIQIYTDMMTAPGEFGMPLYRIDECRGDEKSKAYHMSGIVFALGMCGELENELYVDKDKYIAALKENGITKPQVMLGRLKDYGFCFTGFKDNKFDVPVFTVNYPDDKRILCVIMAFGRKMSFLRPRTRNCFTYNSQMHRLSPRCLESASDYIPTFDYYDYEAALGEKAEIIKFFNNLMNEKGYVPIYKEFYRIIYENGEKLTTNHYSVVYNYDTEQNVSIIIPLHNLSLYSHLVSRMPDKIKSVLCENTCTNVCKCYKNDRGCDKSIKYIIDGTEYERCAWKFTKFTNIKPDEYKHIKTLFENEYQVKKSVIKRQFTL